MGGTKSANDNKVSNIGVPNLQTTHDPTETPSDISLYLCKRRL